MPSPGWFSKSLTIQVAPETHQALAALSERERESMARLVRKMIEAGLQREHISGEEPKSAA
jgi:predicted DNA-binding protein